MTVMIDRSSTPIRDLVREELDELIAIRHDLHAHPELAYEEQRTCKVVQSELTATGMQYKPGLAGGTGVLGHLPGAAERAVGLRADMDALPIHEESDLPYRSVIDGKMHACGHDGHTTILLGAARVLARLAREGELPRPVTFFFQPAEEGGAGAERMINDGCLDGSVLGPPVENMFGLHGWPRSPLGIVTSRPGPMLAAADTWDIIIHGCGSHAAWPHVGRDPIVAGSAIIAALQSIVSRNISPMESAVVSTTRMQGGTAYNVLPERVTLAGTARTLLPRTRDLVERRLTEIAQNIADAHGCQATVTYERGYPITENDADAYETWRQVASDTIGEDRVQFMETPVMGGEDFSYYGRIVPSCFFTLGLVPPNIANAPDLHQAQFDFNDDAIATGVELFCALALR